ncbi:MAG TPA: aminomethyl transferase family protein, partial [Verrucomicrobiae bacterium]|nr:aminomethyl transferase family protein [Verrucomicrobiae bacterium]
MNKRLDIEKYREDWKKGIQWDKPFYVERPPLFSPAAAAQENHGACQVMVRFITNWIPWQYTNFVDEGMSFHKTAMLGDWSSLIKLRIKGPDAAKFLSHHTTNNLAKFALGQIKHAVQTDEEGKVAGEGVLFKVTDDDFAYQGGGADWLNHWLQKGKWDAEARIDSPDTFVFHVQGPQSLAVIEKATGESFRDVRFLWSKKSKIAGAEVLVLRMGVTGELGYEVHGPSEWGNDVWIAIHEAGQEFGLKLMGRRAQIIGHVESGIATIIRDFLPAAAATAGKSKSHVPDMMGGSYEWTDPKELTRTPAELG